MRPSSNYILIFLLSLLPLLSLFLTGKLLHTHDGLVHLARIAAYKKALSDFEFPVRWAGDLNYGYGMPIFNFIYQLPYFVSSLFLFIGFSLVSSFKASLALSYILSGLFMYAFAKEFFKDEKKAFLISVFYQFASYHLVDLLIRGDFAELYAIAFAPLVLYFLVRLFQKGNIKNIAGVAIATALLVVSHNSLSLLFFGVACLFVIFFAGKSQVFIKSAFSLGLGLCLSAFYWAPALLEHKYTYGDLFMKNMYTTNFPPFVNLFLPNFFNSTKLQVGGIPVQLGLFHIVALALSIIIFFSKKISKVEKRFFVLLFTLVILTLFFMTPYSRFIWEKQSYLRQFQFPWRFLAITSFATSLLSVTFFSFSWFGKKVFWIVIFLAIVSTAYYWKPILGFDTVNEAYYWNYPLNTTYFGETDLIWSAGQYYSYPKAPIEVIDKKALATNYKRKTQKHSFTVVSPNGAKLVDHTQYYPGWTVYVNGKQVETQYQFRIYPGQLVYEVPAGTNIVSVEFKETKVRLLSDMISFFALVGIGVFAFFKKIGK